VSVPVVSGLDLGKSYDYSALAVCQQAQGPDPMAPSRPCWHYVCDHLQRWPLGTPYTTVNDRRGIGDDVAAIFGHPSLARSLVAVDQSGVGAAVLDLLRSLRPPCVLVGVTITGGYTARPSGVLEWHVPKAALVSLLVSLMHSGRLKVSPALQLAPQLSRELSAFREKQAAGGSLTYEADRPGDHDDLVICLALAVWLGEIAPPYTAGMIGRGRPSAAHAAPPGTFLPAGPGLGRPGKVPERW
jgi:hypothetical protein